MRAKARACDICGKMHGIKRPCPGEVAGVEYAHPSCLRDRKSADAKEAAIAEIDDPEDRELVLFMLQAKDTEANPGAKLYTVLDKTIEIYLRRKVREEGGARTAPFVDWLAAKGITLRAWQLHLAYQYFAQPPAAGKTFLIELIREYEAGQGGVE